MNRLILLLLLLAPSAFARSQERVSLDARMTEGGIPVWMVNVTCDGLDSTLTVMPDTATGHFRLVVPRGRCLLNSLYNEEIVLDLQSDTVLDLEAKIRLYYYTLDHVFQSRRQKDSLFRAQETALLADLDGWDSTHWHPNLVSLLDLYQTDLYYPLPRWRTFNLDVIYNYLIYCYFKDSDEYDYLYYPICQLEHRLGLKHNRSVRKPKEPDGSWYVPMPEVKEDWLADTLTCYSCLFESAKFKSGYLKEYFSSQGEPSMAYPRRKQPAVRLLVYGGMSDFTALRVEDGYFYYCTTDKPWKIEEARHRERWSVKLTSGELDTLWSCVDTLLMAGDERVLDDCFGIDAPNIEFEYSDRNGYRNYVCATPGKHPLTAPLDKFLDTLWRRNVCLLKVPIYDADDSVQIINATITLEGQNYHHVGSSGYILGPRFFVPKGNYILRIECKGYEPFERELNIQGDLSLDTIRLQHKRFTPNVAQELADRKREVLAFMGEPSLSSPQREWPAVRWTIDFALGTEMKVYRIDGDTLFVKYKYNTLDVQDPFDETVDPDAFWPDTVEVRKVALAAADLDTLTHLLKAIDADNYDHYVTPSTKWVFDPSWHHFEYVLDGRYRSFTAWNPSALPPVKALMDWLLEIEK